MLLYKINMPRQKKVVLMVEEPRKVGGAKRKRGRARKRHIGGAWYNNWSDLWSGIKSVAKPIASFVKDNQLISKGLQAAGNPYGLATGARALGLGRKRKRGGNMSVKY